MKQKSLLVSPLVSFVNAQLNRMFSPGFFCAGLLILCLMSGALVFGQDTRGATGQGARNIWSGKRVPALIANAESGAPFSFVYNGKPSGQILTSWRRTSSRSTLAGGREREVTRYSDPATGLEVTRETIRFANPPAIEWLLRFRNAGSVDTPILENILPLDFQFTAPGTGDIVLHHAFASAERKYMGANSSGMAGDYAPIVESLASGRGLSFAHYVMDEDLSSIGSTKESYLPFFNLQWSDGGLIGGIGWTGQWEVCARRDSARGLILQVGQQTTHLKLYPGESIRTPRVLLLQWDGQDRIRGHNLLRRLLIAHYVPRMGGEVVLPPVAHTNWFVPLFDAVARKTGRNPLEVLPTLQGSDLTREHWGDDGMAWGNYVTEQNQVDLIRGMPPVGIEAYWMDAGWFEGGYPYGVGSWVPDGKKFPRGLKPVGDAAHAKGLKFLLWFDPWLVDPKSLIGKQHPEWVLRDPRQGEKAQGNFNFGDPAARQWMADLLAKCIQEWGIDIYRQDAGPLLLFSHPADTPERQGIAEIRWIEGFYALWDELLARHPGLVIDNANWGLTGPDLEVMKRSVGSLTRSELDGVGIPYPVADQFQTAALSLWIPLHATFVHALDPYTFRSAATTGVGIGLNLQSPYIPIADLRKAIAELKSLRPFWLGDYYPLTEIDRDERAWCGWQLNRPDLGGGFAIFFRRSKSPDATFHAILRGLDPKAKYEVTFAESYDVKQRDVLTGAALARLRVQIGSAPGSTLVRYHKLAPTKPVEAR